MIKTSEIKKTALNQLKGKWSKAFSIATLFTLVNIALSYTVTIIQNATTQTPILYYGVNLIYLAIFLPLSFGLTSSIRKLLKEQEVGVTSFLNDALLNSTKAVTIFIRTLLKMIIPSLIIIAGIIGILFVTSQIIPLTNATMSGYIAYISLLSIIVFIGIALTALPYVLSSFVLIDNKDLKVKEIIAQSAILMENKKWNFVKLIISFLGWILLLALISTIVARFTFEEMSTYVQWFGMIFLLPYLTASISIFYEEASDNN